MCKNRRIFLIVCIICIFSAAATTVYAHEIPDLTRTGSVSVTLTCEEKAVSGGTLILYRVGRISEDDGDYSFTLTDEFEASGAELTDISAADLAEDLAEYVSLNDISGGASAAVEDGTAFFADIEPGLYLVEQSEAAAGYEKLLPFLVTVPTNENGKYVYNVNASPKLTEIKKKPEESGRPDKPGPSSGQNYLQSGASPTLPQTGQLNWPVPVCAILGMCLFLLGFALRFGYKGKNET